MASEEENLEIAGDGDGTVDSVETKQEHSRVPRRKRHGARHRARRRAVDILYEAENRDTDPVALIEERESLRTESDDTIPPIASYTKEIVSGVAKELDSIDDSIERYLSADWELHRLPAVDRAILRVSVWELRFNPEIPAPIGVVEGVELASEYSDPSSAGYINALLDDVAQAQDVGSPMTDIDAESDGPDDAEPDETEPVAGGDDQ